MEDNIPKRELIAALEEAQADINKLQAQLDEYKWVDTALKKRTLELSERVKELDCLYRISAECIQPGKPLDDILDDIVAIIPRGWQYPKLTIVRVCIGDDTCVSKGFHTTPYVQSAPIVISAKTAGTIEIFVDYKKPVQTPFLPEEDNLLNAVALWIGDIVKRKSVSA